MSFYSFMLRTLFKRSDDRRDRGLSVPEDIRRFDDIRYGPDARWNVLDVYRPRAQEGKLPVIVSVHGGGWVYGDKERYQYYCMGLAQHGFAVVNFSYRLAPEYKFPAPLEDTNAVFCWVLANAGRYGLDPGRVFGVGDSAGAHILSLYSCLCTNPAYASTLSISPPEGFRPTALALNCGAYRIEKSGKADTRLMADFLPQKGTDAELELICVPAHVTEDFPPSFIMTCEGDFMAPEAPPMAEKLESLGVPVTYRYYGDPEHVLGHVFHCNMRSEDAARCNRDECEFFKGFLSE